MKLNILAHSLRVIFTGGMTVGMGLMVNTAHADDKVERVEVTGSSIKGIAAQSASPITVVKVEQLAAAGVTEPKALLAAGLSSCLPPVIRWLNPNDQGLGIQK